MNKGRIIFAGLFLTSLALLLSGCEEDYAWMILSPASGLFAGSGSSGPSGPPPVGADVGGHWNGRYLNEHNGYTFSLTADVVQVTDAITIETSIPTGEGHLFHGTINSNAHIHVTDAFTAQEWTSERSATNNWLQIRDYVFSPEVNEPEPPLQIITLTR